MARRGARALGDADPGTASAAWRDAIARSRGDEEVGGPPPPKWEPELWVEDVEPEADVADPPGTKRTKSTAAASAATDATASGRPRPRRRLPETVRDELASAVGSNRAERFTDRLAEATRAYERDRYQDARRILKKLAEVAPGSAAVRELLGLTLYRDGRWAEAAKELEAYAQMTGSTDQHPALADCYRALHRHHRVDELWDELRRASPSAEVVTEGRIVTAESMAERGDVAGAVKLLEKGGLDRKRPREHHLRQWYALADLYERAGDIPRARQLFARIASHDPETFEVEDRLRALR